MTHIPTGSNPIALAELPPTFSDIAIVFVRPSGEEIISSGNHDIIIYYDSWLVNQII